MSNAAPARKAKLDEWLNNQKLHKGFLSIFDDEPFDYDNTSRAYEIGRQIAIIAKSKGIKRRSELLRKLPKKERMNFVKTKLSMLSDIVYNELENVLSIEPF